MNNYVNKGTLLIAILIFGISTFLIPILTNALPLPLSANAKVWSPWYTSKTKAEGISIMATSTMDRGFHNTT